MVIVVTLKELNWQHRYENVTSYEVVPKERIKDEVDETTYNEIGKYIFRMYFENGEQATFTALDKNGLTNDFSYKVLSYS